ncbi:Type I inositol 1,4,5-trisphosphate 5-phosphatase 12 [Auxenochlorella protothecoides]|uniref:Type I inositol 1,4,5-trisphosphate 5-phosphatase 12 n=1 Tax=Auxenochlorella protothecoides TaxID=3075 RepID=A0A087SPV7_AUXPR|nr:Type I inositol 1,4,5-trisphosphate 5-phosphatase 12 [Auxenochlorella protothecoides]KFM27761.1 Type I inositol 1,4,5-trisphosphate 5-phosphatase 12 [Auxenochlorella protothecoides]
MPQPPVDGVEDSTVTQWFRDADSDSDGRVADHEARAFFLRSGLSSADLSKIWRLVKSPEVVAREGKGLTEHRFRLMLRLIALAQSEHPFTSKNADVALSPATWLTEHGGPLPAPVFGPAARVETPAGRLPAGAVLKSRAPEPPCEDLALLHLTGASGAAPGQQRAGAQRGVPAPAPGAAVPSVTASGNPFAASVFQEASFPASPAPPGADPAAPFSQDHPSYASSHPAIQTSQSSPWADEDVFGLAALAARAEVPAAEGSGAGVTSQRPASRAAGVASGKEVPLGVELRLPPLDPKHGAHLCMLGALGWSGGLLAGPSLEGGLQQYGCTARDRMVAPAREDADAAPSHTFGPPRKKAVTALFVDHAATVVWTGDRDGWVTGYDLSRASPGQPLSSSEVGWQWQAHRLGHITALCVSPSSGHLWTGSSRGHIRIWPRAPPAPQGHFPAGPLTTREVRRGRDDKPHGGPVRFLAAAADGSTVWSASRSTILLWDAACGAFLGVLVRGGAAAAAGGREAVEGEEAWGLSSAPSYTGLDADADSKQRIPSARGLALGPTGRPLALLPRDFHPRLVADQENWAALSDRGVAEFVERVHMGGSRVVQGAGKAVRMLGKLGKKVAKNLRDPRADAGEEGGGVPAAFPGVEAGLMPLRGWRAHRAAVMALAAGPGRIYSLAASGEIVAWPAAQASLHSAAVPSAQRLWREVAATTFSRRSLRALALTWNVNECKPDPDSSQEIEMGSSSVALAAAKDAISYRMQERGNTNAKFWSGAVLRALGGEAAWQLVGLRQLSGMLVLAYARHDLKEWLGEVATASVACGVLGVGGNKGAVAVEFSLFRHKVALLCSHFAAHQGAVEARNANYQAIVKALTFTRRAWLADEDVDEALAAPGGAGLGDGDEAEAGTSGPQLTTLGPGASAANLAEAAAAQDPLVQGDAVQKAEALIWAGDFNYRIDGPYEDIRDRAVRNDCASLLPLDQCRREMAAGQTFRGMREGPITFRPTYKFDKASANPFAYDSSEKRRVPAWCDRIFFRGCPAFPSPEPLPDERDAWADRATAGPDVVLMTCHEYGCWADVAESDHKPVYALLGIDLSVNDWEARRARRNQILDGLAEEEMAGRVPLDDEDAVKLTPDRLQLRGSVGKSCQLQNSLGRTLRFSVVVPPRSLEEGLRVFPLGGALPPDATLQLHLEFDPGSGALHKNRDLVARLTVVVSEEGDLGSQPGQHASQLLTLPLEVSVAPPLY